MNFWHSTQLVKKAASFSNKRRGWHAFFPSKKDVRVCLFYLIKIEQNANSQSCSGLGISFVSFPLISDVLNHRNPRKGTLTCPESRAVQELSQRDQTLWRGGVVVVVVDVFLQMLHALYYAVCTANVHSAGGVVLFCLFLHPDLFLWRSILHSC